VIDTHCHLNFPDFDPDRYPGGVDAVLAKAAAKGVDGYITVSTTTHAATELLSLANRYERVWCSAGVHPLYSDEGPHDWEAMRRVGEHRKCVAWGELGLDNHYTKPPRAVQHEVLADQLGHIEQWAAGGLVKPVIIHCRDAFADLLPILRAAQIPGDRYVFHCFTGTADDVRKVLDFGSYVSFTGVVTYKNAQNVRDAAVLVPADRIMIETDSPFLAPEPHRTTRPCEPWMASVTARAVATLRGVAWEEFEGQINRNTRAFFGIS